MINFQASEDNNAGAFFATVEGVTIEDALDDYTFNDNSVLSDCGQPPLLPFSSNFENSGSSTQNPGTPCGPS
eukprot:3800305-Rhodomonas_salina.1